MTKYQILNKLTNGVLTTRFARDSCEKVLSSIANKAAIAHIGRSHLVIWMSNIYQLLTWDGGVFTKNYTEKWKIFPRAHFSFQGPCNKPKVHRQEMYNHLERNIDSCKSRSRRRLKTTVEIKKVQNTTKPNIVDFNFNQIEGKITRTWLANEEGIFS